MLRVESVGKTFPRPSGLTRFLIRAASPEPVEALRNIDLQVDPGEIVGLVGPNGAGKTTLLRIISTLLDPTTGQVTVDGFDTSRHPTEVRERVGLVLADDRALYWRLTGRQNLEFFGRMVGLSRRDASRRGEELLERLGLAHRDKLVFGYSSGMRSRLSFARAMLAAPPLLVLDEATRALDPVAQTDVAALLSELRAGGTAILMSSHRLDEIESVCDRITVVVHGEVRYAGTIADLAGTARFSEALHAVLVGGADPSPPSDGPEP
jgi:ABC-type multidrug transport system ATPase subunit